MSNRGQPLATLPNGTTSFGYPRKISLAPASRQSSIGARQSLGPRVSSIGISNNRTSSIGARKSSIGTKQSSYRGSGQKLGDDPRNITDKAVQKEMITAIIMYLSENQYPQQLSFKMLASPSSKDFMNILEFLFRKMDPAYTRAGPKPDDDVAYIFARLRYPFPLSKRSVSNVGAMHTWPAFLAALHWIVELLRYGDEGCKFDEEDDALPLENQQFFTYLQRSYHHFLAGGDNFEPFERDLKANFEQKLRATQLDLDNINSSKNEVIQEKQQIADKWKYFEDVRAKKVAVAADVTKFKDFSEKLTSHIQNLETKLHNTKKELEAKESELAAANADKENLTAAVAAQQHNAVDAVKINKDKTSMEEELIHVRSQRDKAEGAIWTEEMAIAKKMEDIERKLQYYHEVARRMQLIGGKAKLANGVNYNIQFNTHSNAAEEEIQADLKSKIKPAFKALKNELQNKILEMKQEDMSCQDQIRQLNETLAEQQEEAREAETKLKKLEAVKKQDKEKQNSELQIIESETDSMNAEIARLHEAGLVALGKSKKTIEAAQQEQVELGQQIAQAETDMNNSILYVLDLVTKHKHHVERELDELNAFMRKTFAEVSAEPSPRAMLPK